MAKKKYYAYRLRDGASDVVDTWKDCERKVSGVYGARYKGFVSKSEAEAWLVGGAKYEVSSRKSLVVSRKLQLQPGIYFDAGTGRGKGTEISVTDEQGENLLHKVLSKKEINKFGKHLVGKTATNNYGELLACLYAMQVAMKTGVKKVFGDSKLVIDYWSKGFIKKDKVAEETVELAEVVAGLREEFEEGGGVLDRISGDHNPADLGFHR
ncbi:MAG: ribonuclease H family protein [bacterium]|nr:ribonuclease H family protein [bacterium]